MEPRIKNKKYDIKPKLLNPYIHDKKNVQDLN